MDRARQKDTEREKGGGEERDGEWREKGWRLKEEHDAIFWRKQEKKNHKPNKFIGIAGELLTPPC